VGVVNFCDAIKKRRVGKDGHQRKVESWDLGGGIKKIVTQNRYSYVRQCKIFELPKILTI
jgi:hypothetical protein